MSSRHAREFLAKYFKFCTEPISIFFLQIHIFQSIYTTNFMLLELTEIA